MKKTTTFLRFLLVLVLYAERSCADTEEVQIQENLLVRKSLSVEFIYFEFVKFI